MCSRSGAGRILRPWWANSLSCQAAKGEDCHQRACEPELHSRTQRSGTARIPVLVLERALGQRLGDGLQHRPLMGQRLEQILGGELDAVRDRVGTPLAFQLERPAADVVAALEESIERRTPS